MNAKTTAQRGQSADVDIEQFLADHYDEVASKLAAARAEIAAGQAEALEPLDELLRDARLRAAQ
jgi:HEAT repeat protein